MTLLNYLQERKMSAVAFSEISGIPYSTIYSYLKRDKTPNSEMAYIIYKVTGGMVQSFDFITKEKKKVLDAKIAALSKSVN